MTNIKTYLLCILLLIIGGNTTVCAQKKFKTSSSRQIEVDRDAVSNNLYYAESIFDDSLSIALAIIEDNLFIAIENKFTGEEALAYRILATLTNPSLIIHWPYQSMRKQSNFTD